MQKLFFTILVLTSFNVLAGKHMEIQPCGEEKDSKILFIERAAPIYPNHSRRPYVDAQVKLKITVNPEGRAVNIIVINAEPKRLFDRSAKHYLKKSVYSKSKEVKDRCGIVEVNYKLEQD